MTETTLYQVEDGWIELVSGRKCHFGAEPRELANVINVEDVAWSLSRLCRYNGHTRRFYTVAEHAILMADWVENMGGGPRECLTALHHDDAEYIIGDLPRPIKVKMPQFKQLEQRLDEAVAIRFNTIFPLPKWLKDLDARILHDERRAVMNRSENEWGTDALQPLDVKFMWLSGHFPMLLRHKFIQRHRRWVKELRKPARHGRDLASRSDLIGTSCQLSTP